MRKHPTFLGSITVISMICTYFYGFFKLPFKLQILAILLLVLFILKNKE